MVNVGLQVILEVVDLFGHGEVVDLGHFVFFKILSDIHLIDDIHSRGEKISVRSSNHLMHLIPSKEMTIEEAVQNFRAIGEVLYVPKCL